MNSPWIARGVLIALFVAIAWQTLVATSAETAAWNRANDLRSAAGCAEYLAWAQRALAPESRSPFALYRSIVLPWVTAVESHQRVAQGCPAPVSDKWTR